MINKFDLAKSLRDEAKSLADTEGYGFIEQDDPFTPETNEIYIQEFILFGTDNSIGLEDGSADIQYGVYQLNINAPKSNMGSKWTALKIAEQFRDSFKRGSEFIYNEQMTRVRTSDVIKLDNSATHTIYALSIKYSVIK